MGELYHVSAYGRIGRFLSWMSLSALCVIMLYSMMLYVFWGEKLHRLFSHCDILHDSALFFETYHKS